MKKIICLFICSTYFLLLHAQVVTDSIIVEGKSRIFHYNKPSGSIKDFSLIFILHGSGGEGKGMMKPASGLEKISKNERIFLVYPDGYKNYWNECRKRANSVANIEDINEQAFFNSMMAYFKKRYHIDGHHAFAIGFSGGGHMTYKLALTMPEKIKGISAIVANLPDSTNLDCEQSRKPVAVMIINGTNDSVNPYDGGQMSVNGSSFGGVYSSDRTFRYWTNIAGYKGVPVFSLMSGTAGSTQQIHRYSYKRKGSPEVTLLKVVGGGHSFPEGIDAFIESWNFFKRQINK